MLHLIYRSYGGENRKGRPAFYSKRLALASCIRAFQALEAHEPGSAELIFLNDGPIADDLVEMMERSGEVLARPHRGLRASVRASLDLPAARGWAPDDLVWFAEDDYLYKPRALVDLVRSKRVTKEDALAQSDSPTNLLWLLENTEDASVEPAAPPPLRGPEPPSAGPPPALCVMRVVSPVCRSWT